MFNHQLSVIYFPPYSPHLNSVEHIWVALKLVVQRYRRQILSDPETALAVILEHYRNFDVLGFLRRM